MGEQLKSQDAIVAIKAFEARQLKIKNDYKKSLAKLNKEIEDARKKSQDSLLASLNSALVKASKAVDLDEANAINSTIQQIQDYNSKDKLDSTDFATNNLDISILDGKWIGEWGGVPPFSVPVVMRVRVG